MTTPAEQLAERLASGLFHADAAERKRARAELAAHPLPAVATFFATDKRSYHSIHEGAKLVKAARAFVALGADGPRFALALIEAWRARPARYAHELEALLAVPMAFGVEAEAFGLLTDETEVFLPGPKKALPAGLSKLTSLQKLRIPEGTITRNDNIAELGALPEPIRLELWVKDVDLALFEPASQRVRELHLRGRYSNLAEVSALRGWKKLTTLGLAGTQVADLSPLRDLPLTALILNETRVTDLSPLRAFAGLAALGLRRVAAADFSVVGEMTELTHLELSFTPVRDLRLLDRLAKLRSLDLWGTPVDSLEPLVDKPIEWLCLNWSVLPDLSPLIRIPTLKLVVMVGAPDDTPGLAALAAARPDLRISR